MTDSAHAHAHTNGIEAGLLLPPHTKMVIVAVGTCIFSCRRGLPSEALDQSPAKAIQTPFLQKKRKAALRPWSASALIVKNFDDLNDDVMCLTGFNEPFKIRGNGKAAGSHLSADEDVKARIEGPMNELGRRHQSNVLRLVVRAVLNATCDGHVELARKVRKFRIAAGAYNRPVEVNHNG